MVRPDEKQACGCQSSLIWKLNRTQLFGGVQHPGKNKKFQYFKTLSSKYQIKLKSLQSEKLFGKGHIFIGFSADGKYLISYRCEMITDVGLLLSVRYIYFLYWWLFDLWKPLLKVRKVELFANENISQELHLLFCQPFDNDYIVIHGTTYNSNDHSDNGSLCYVAVIPTNEFNQTEYSINLLYELFPPYPPFMTSVCVKLNNVILLNSGDMLFAIIINGGKRLKTKFLLQNRSCHCDNRLCHCDNRLCHCDNRLCHCDNRLCHCDNRLCHCGKYLITGKEILLNQKKYESKMSDFNNHIEQNSSRCNSYNIPSCISYVIQGFSLPNEEEWEETSTTSFDCTSMIIPIQVILNNKKLKVSYEHRCFIHKSDHKTDADLFISQAQFNPETFMNEQIQQADGMKDRYVSMRDYDMQLVEVCQTTNEVVILLNALVILREKINSNGDNINRYVDNVTQRSNRLSLYKFGFVVSWNVYRGRVTVLRKLKPMLDGVGTENKSQNFSPSLSTMVQIRKKWFVPVGKHISIQTLSNHTVFSGSSLTHMHHPYLPIAIVI